MLFRILTLLLLCSLLAGTRLSASQERPRQQHKVPVAIEEGKVFEKDGRRLLYGGEDPSWNFDITDFSLDPAKLHHGLGREYSKALFEPRFVMADKANGWLAEDAKVLAVRIGQEVRVYPVNLLVQHKVVNDVVAGRPIMAAYCILADLGSVYDRAYYDCNFNFGCSGYTYASPEIWDGRDSFLLWDRETESLWLPATGLAVSGPMKGEAMKVLDEALWSQTTWGKVKALYPQAVVLDPEQSFEPPASWTKYDPEQIRAGHDRETAARNVPPRWGENTGLAGDKP